MSSLLERLKAQGEEGNGSDRILVYRREGYVIYVGKNAASNEALVKDHPHRGCLWFHAMASRGSHVVLCIEGHGESVPDGVIEGAARLALEHSESQAQTVRMATLEKVLKPEGAREGIWHAEPFMTVEVPA